MLPGGYGVNMKCPECGKFMRRDGIGVDDYGATYWACKCSVKYTVFSTRLGYIFPREVIVLVDKETK